MIVGGFSYEDRGRAGLIAAKNSILNALECEAEKGKPILGICNGAQILLESGLLLGDKSQRHRVALAQNRRLRDGEVLGTGYYNDWVWIKKHQAANPDGAFVNAVPGPICVPVAHGEGRFLIDEELYQSLQAQGAPMWQYCQEDGALDEHFPCNPNGSMYNLAALSNVSGTICAMMPHPERTENGDSVFKSMARYIAQKKKQNSLFFHTKSVTVLIILKNQT